MLLIRTCPEVFSTSEDGVTVAIDINKTRETMQANCFPGLFRDFFRGVFSKSVNGINMSLTDSVNGQKYANGELVNKQKQHERGDHESEIL